MWKVEWMAIKVPIWYDSMESMQWNFDAKVYDSNSAFISLSPKVQSGIGEEA